MSALPPEAQRRAAADAFASLTENQRQAVVQVCRQYWSEAGFTSASEGAPAAPSSLADATHRALGAVIVLTGDPQDPPIPAHCLQCLIYAESYFAEWGEYPYCDDPIIESCNDCTIAIPCQEPS